MRNKWMIMSAIVVLLVSIFGVDNANAYLKNNCFSVQWKVTGNTNSYYTGGGAAGMHATQLICLEGDKLVSKNVNDEGASNTGRIAYSFNILKVESDGKTVTLSDNGSGKVKTSKTFTLKDKNIEGLADEIYKHIQKEGIKPTDNATLFALNDNTEYSQEEYNASDDSGCKGAGGALGWIICPVIKLAGEAADGIYSEYVAPALQVEPQLFSSSDKTVGVRGAWDTFRNFANIIFVILLLFVIFSQVTGVGIDNYGIKKILPKLIISAVLINLSYVLCILAVDISNILGNAFQALFTSLGEQLSPQVNDGNGMQSLAVTGGTLVGLGAFGHLAVTTAPIWGPGVIITLLMGGISLIVSIIFLFILLAAREAAIIVLIVLAPVAVVLYALPNTKSYFDKWLKFFGSLLMVYPIAGLLVGGGNYISALLLSTDMASNFFTALTAMIAGVIPIFFIPIALKQSLAIAGNLGERISRVGNSVGAGLGRAGGGALQNNEKFRSFQRESARKAGLNLNNASIARVNRKHSALANSYMSKHGIDKDDEEGREMAMQQTLGYLSEKDIRDKAYAEQGILKAKREDQEAMNVLGASMYRDMSKDDMDSKLKDAIQKGNEAQIEMMITSMTDRFGPAAAESVAKALEKIDVGTKENPNKEAAAAIHGLQNVIQNNNAFAGAFKDKSPDAFAMVSNGAKDNSGNLQNLSYFSETQQVATNVSDWSKASAGAIGRSMTPEMAQKIIDSNDPAIMSTIKADEGKMEAVFTARDKGAKRTES